MIWSWVGFNFSIIIFACQLDVRNAYIYPRVCELNWVMLLFYDVPA